MNKKILFAALFLAALSIGFVACDVFDPDLGKENEDENDNIENVVDDDSTDIDSDSIDNVEGEEDYYNCDSTEMICTGVAYNITATTAKVPGTVHIPLTLLAQCQLGVQVSSSKEDLIAHENVTNFTTKDLTGNDFVVNLENLKSSATTYYYCAYIYLNGLYHYGPIREFKTLCVLTLKTKGDNATSTTIGAGEFAYGTEAPISTTSGENYYFTSWSDCDSKELSRTITLTSDSTITANFAKKPYLTVKTEYASCGTVSGSGYYMPGEEVTITATPKPGFKFVKWNDSNTDNTRIITMGYVSVTYTATFEVSPNNVISGTENGYDYVDLGLPSGLKWATCNVGATTPEGYGDYFAWGEVEPKEVYDWSTYKFMDSNVNDWNGVTKYTFFDNQREGVWYDSEGNFIGDNKTTLDSEDDAAAVNMGGSWRMPTYNEFDELETECTCTWTTLNGVNGCNVEGPNGNAIFLPAAGYRGSSGLGSAGSYGYYWLSSLYTYNSYKAQGFDFLSNIVMWRYFYSRYCGQSVRGVCE